MTIITNFLIFLFSVFCFRKLKQFKHPYPRNFAWFILLVGISSCFGSVAHGAHYQLGEFFFKTDFYIMNALSLISVYFCFNGPYIYHNLKRPHINKNIPYAVIAWIVCLLIYTLIQNTFVIVKIHAGIVLLYSFVIHLMSYHRTKEKGSGLIVLGIGVSFFSILVHSLKLSIDEWFNYKDLAHIIILASLVLIYRGVKLNSEKLIKA